MGLFFNRGQDEEEEKRELEEIIKDAKEEIQILEQEINIDKSVIEEAKDTERKINELENKEQEIDQLLTDLSNRSNPSVMDLIQNSNVSDQKESERQRLIKDLGDAFNEAETLTNEIADIEEKIKNQINAEKIAQQDMQETAALINQVEQHQQNANKKFESIKAKMESREVEV